MDLAIKKGNMLRQVERLCTHHVIDDAYGFADRTCLETHMIHPADKILYRDGSTSECIKFKLLNFL